MLSYHYMLTNNFAWYSVKIFSELVNEIIYFPVWWYSKGLINLIEILEKFLINKEKSLALLVWIKNIFRPMYGQFDWVGVLISFFMRLFQIIVRSLMMILWLLLAFFILCFWLILPLLVIYEIIFQLFL